MSLHNDIKNILARLEETGDHAVPHIRQLCRDAADIITRLHGYNEELQSFDHISTLALDRLRNDNEDLTLTVDHMAQEIHYLTERLNEVFPEEEQKETFFCDHCGDILPNESMLHEVCELPVDISSANMGESARLCHKCFGELIPDHK